MADQFPEIIPSSRGFTVGDFPSVAYRTLSGAVFRRAFGNRQTGHRLTLEFRNIGEAGQIKDDSGNVYEILNHYSKCNGTLDTFKIPTKVFQGMEVGFGPLIQGPNDVRWHYASPPQVRNVRAGVSTVRVELIGELEA